MNFHNASLLRLAHLFEIMVDTLHPNDAGHRVIARKVQVFLDSHF
ncbi:hypothetical protein Nizo1840_3088 [Lactiplantibacillus plantarum]|nr:hypothetical protein Nizo1840_3088 [Lactiplantibacillus plantarum]